MRKLIFAATCGVLALLAPAAGFAQIKPEMIQRAKKATALVEVSAAKGGATGSAFCIDKSGLFITNAHVVDMPDDSNVTVRLVLEIGQEAQRSVEAKVLRHDDRLDLALLKVDGDSGLVALERGKETDLKELTGLVTFGYPFGHSAAVGGAKYPDVTVLPSRITSLRKSNGRLVAIQFDNQINPGNSGGPVLDAGGQVVGVARATVQGATLNLAIPVGQVADFLRAPGLSFEPPPLKFEDRARPVTWTIQVQPSMPGIKLPADLSVAVKVPNEAGASQTFPARPATPGTYQAEVRPVAPSPERKVELSVKKSFTEEAVEVRFKEEDVSGGETRFMLTVLRLLFEGRSLRAPLVPGEFLSEPRPGAEKGDPRTPKRVLVDLGQANPIRITPLNWPAYQALEATLIASQGSRVVATIRKKVKLSGAPRTAIQGQPVVTLCLPRPIPKGGLYTPPDEGQIRLEGALDADGIPRGAGRSIHPPEAKAGASLAELAAGSKTPLVRRLDGTISDVVVGGGGRYLLLCLKEARKIAVFDVNSADIVKTIPLPSSNVMVAAGARKILIAFPEEKLIQRWDLETLQRDGGSRPLPIDGPLRALVMGSDSDGPALALWIVERPEFGLHRGGLSLIDVDSLMVLKAGLLASSGSIDPLSASGGTFMLRGLTDTLDVKTVPPHIRASAGGSLFAIWCTTQIPSGFQTLRVRGSALFSIYKAEQVGYLVPGPDGRTVYSGVSGRIDADGTPLDRSEPKRDGQTIELTIPTNDPAYYLRFGPLRPDVSGPAAANEPIVASIHCSDGTRLLSLGGLDEMVETYRRERQDGFWIKDDFSIDKRFHAIPSANLLITIPPSNDRLVLRRLALTEAPDNTLVMVSPSFLSTKAGQKLEHQVVARSKKGGFTYSLVHGPDGLSVSPDGKLTWSVPDGQSGEDVTAAVAVSDAAGQKRTHQLQIYVK